MWCSIHAMTVTDFLMRAHCFHAYHVVWALLL